jgi:hypothetical protein
MLPQPLAALASHRQFILYRSAPSSSRPGKTEKYPCSPTTGQIINAHDPTQWTDAVTAFMLAPLFGPTYGVGFVLTPSTGLFCLDIDDCLTPTGWSKQALDMCAAFPGAAVEVSSSGRGLHIWGSGVVPPHSCKNTALGIELYDSSRFIALGQPNATGNAATDCTEPLARIVAQYFPPSASTSVPEEWTNGPCAEWSGPDDDDELLRRMFAAKPSMASTFGGKATLAQLWDADVKALATSYPSASAGQAYGESEVDSALCAHLAWWTGRDMERMRRLMQRSALRRDKWERDDYIQRTIMRACAVCATVYHERPADLPGSAPVAPATVALPADPDDPTKIDNVVTISRKGRHINGSAFVTPETQLEMWDGYTFITDENVILTDAGQKWNQSQFTNRYKGSVYMIDKDNGAGSTTKDPWEAFVGSRCLRMPKVDHSAFRPDMDPSEVWIRDGASYVNSFRRIDVARKKGDVTPFMQHMAKVLPIQRDRDILLAYMAALVQHQGVKFQWAPIIQGTEGNGKTLFSRCVSEAVGARYTHMPRASEIAEKFNDWLVGKVFIGVEDVWYPEGRTEIIETLKPMITNSRLPIRAMRQSERTMDVCANFIINSNHKDAIRKTSNSRRWCVMFCAQQSKEDKIRDGMTEQYFKDLYRWLANGGYAMVTEFLYTYEIPAEFGLDCLCGDAPDTSSTEEAIAVGLGRVEQEVLEAIHSGASGFCGGWVSSHALDKLLKEQRMDAAMPRSKRRDMMQALGYDWHPGLRNGRSTTALPGTNERPILFVRRGHHSSGMDGGPEIIAAYIKAQMPGAVELGLVPAVPREVVG